MEDLLPDVSQLVGPVLRHEEDETCDYVDGKDVGFCLVREGPFFLSDDEIVFARNPPR